MRRKRLCRTLVYACGFLAVTAALAYASPSETPRDISTVAEAMVDKAKLPTAEAVTPTNQTPAAETPKAAQPTSTAEKATAAGDADKPGPTVSPIPPISVLLPCPA